jgi:putative spermidine/putrescine transport system ATP-binding protein
MAGPWPPALSSMLLELIDLQKSFGETPAVRAATCRIETGRVLSLLGPSGCGKTTTLRMIAGFEQPTGGQILLGGRNVTAVPARKRNVGMVFQSYALFPHMSAAQNVAFGLEMRGIGRADRERRVARALDIVRMSKLADRMPKQLSGGQQQRIALARALVIEPDLLLLDEPLSALDLKLREEMRDEIHRIVRELNITTVFVTHDQGEALVLSDLVAVMNDGMIEQLGTPVDVYRNPQTAFVADFIGSANVIKGRERPGEGVFETDFGLILPLPPQRSARIEAVAVRPEDIDLVAETTNGAAKAIVKRARFLGSVIEYTLEADSGCRLTVRTEGRMNLPEQTRVGFAIRPDRVVPLCPSRRDSELP